jgi:VCBS repeat-containing protein
VDLHHHQRPRSARRWPGGERRLHRHHQRRRQRHGDDHDHRHQRRRQPQQRRASLTETDAAQNTGGTLTLTDADTTAATVVAQTNTAGTYGRFSINAAGAWTYTTLSALDTLDAGQVVSDVFTVTTSDGGSATVTITITGTNDVASLSSDSASLTETDAVQNTGGTLTLTDADTTAATVAPQTNTAGTYGRFSINAAGAWTYDTSAPSISSTPARW